LGCIFGCNADEPMVAGGRAYLMVVNDEEIPDFTVESDDPDVMSAMRADEESSTVILESSAAGTAKVVFRDKASGDVFDRFKIYVHDVDRIELNQDDLFDQSFTLMVGGESTIYFDLRDTKDHYLQGIGGVSYSLSGQITADELGLIDAIAEAIVNVLAGSNNESVAIEALGVGSGEIVALAPSGATLAVPVTVVGPEAITRVEVFGEDDPPRIGELYGLNADAFAGAEEVRSPECEWTVAPADGGVTVRSASRSTISVESEVAASATVTCTIGGVSGSYEVRFES
ncbi:MAG: hypothetical protein KC486_21335, partial [Myxococcales bacterium]|nr:hypothetical protein [Myxococcales bacterium]